MANTIKVEGLAELQKRLEQLEPKLQQRVMRKALRDAGKIYQAEIVRRVGGLRLAAQAKAVLAQSVYLQVRKRKGRLVCYVRIRKPNRRTEKKEDAFFWRWIEFGTAERARTLAYHFEHGEIEVEQLSGRKRRKVKYTRSRIRVVRDRTASTGFIPAQPFVRPAAAAAVSAATKTIEDQIRKGIERAFRG